MRAIPALLLTVLAFPLWAGASESIYRYVEKDGTIVYTNVPPTGSKAAKKMKGSFAQAPAKSAPVVGRSRTPPALDPHIAAAALRYRIPTALVRAIMHAESNFNANALSHKGASGLMQLMPGTASDMYVKDIFDERDNIEGGVRYLRVLANMFDGDMVKMIAAYNAGPDAVKRYGGKVPPYEETQGYVRKVLQLYYHYKERERSAEGVTREPNFQNDDAREGAGGDEPR
ncbi:transglycosylase SLT domain-containing protein [Myxococcus stipitatus DSM 14675]|uniref:Transglycosylase SLT domain-containing protein n=1 Tax=Myxococcus stipitatus (strain DSM 14675 / JCM 12634 / Mx s8) TaxID=1278073 RepID=L7UER7_MYXSD|nr:lytic transglycosylase domain-containing protein [Myxococcus stipitatus]AGC46365.1 transglycosylase SLT domain-containing protein [Myxococcus stipitatus DSM 14675]